MTTTQRKETNQVLPVAERQKLRKEISIWMSFLFFFYYFFYFLLFFPEAVCVTFICLLYPLISFFTNHLFYHFFLFFSILFIIMIILSALIYSFLYFSRGLPHRLITDDSFFYHIVINQCHSIQEYTDVKRTSFYSTQFLTYNT